MITCKYCGNGVRPEDRFCLSCGAPPPKEFVYIPPITGMMTANELRQTIGLGIITVGSGGGGGGSNTYFRPISGGNGRSSFPNKVR